MFCFFRLANDDDDDDVEWCLQGTRSPIERQSGRPRALVLLQHWIDDWEVEKTLDVDVKWRDVAVDGGAVADQGDDGWLGSLLLAGTAEKWMRGLNLNIQKWECKSEGCGGHTGGIKSQGIGPTFEFFRQLKPKNISNLFEVLRGRKSKISGSAMGQTVWYWVSETVKPCICSDYSREDGQQQQQRNNKSKAIERILIKLSIWTGTDFGLKLDPSFALTVVWLTGWWVGEEPLEIR